MTLRERGRTLRWLKGSAHRTPGSAGRTLVALYAGALTLASAIAGVLALVVALTGSPSPGVEVDASGEFVRSVDSGGFAWRSGIRPGQRIIALSAADDEGGWHIETADESRQQRATAGAATATLRLSTPVAVAALVLGVFGLVAVPTRRRRAELLAGLSLALASLPIWLAGDAILATLVGVFGPIVLTIWALRWLERGRLPAAMLASIVVALSIAYAVARLYGSALAADLDGVRLTGTIALAAGVLMASLDLRMERLIGPFATFRLLDAGVGVAIVAAAIVAAAALATPLPIVAIVAGIAVLAYLGLRTGIARLADRVLLAEVRERAAVKSAEEERARLSRDLHDDPLQALAGVIHRLERQPDTATEREALRTVAAHLRNVATELHPPVLDDLGLVSAIDALRPTDGEIAVDIAVTDGGYEREHRPPPDIEIAIYRIVAEAIANAIAHSGGRTIRVEGAIGRDQVSVDVVDDGRGVTGREIEAAMRGGHMGVASMRRRADAIDARVTHRGTPGRGTTVSLRWRA